MKYSRKDRIKALKILLEETKESEIKGRVINSPTSKEYKIRHDKSIQENEKIKILELEFVANNDDFVL